VADGGVFRSRLQHPDDCHRLHASILRGNRWEELYSFTDRKEDKGLGAVPRSSACASTVIPGARLSPFALVVGL
jgi:hypothetical protein